MSDIIKIENMCHEYKDAQNNILMALDNINVTIQRGEFVAVIGTNGSGKSTFAKHLNALLLPTRGECWVDGFNTNDEKNLWNIRQTVGMVFQNPDNQIVAAIVEEDVAFGPENLGVESKKIKERVDYALELVGMLEYRNHAPHLLSGGQKQRVAIAGVLAMQPKCLVLDEATAMLDPLGRKEVINTVARLNKEKNITVVYITHFMEEAVIADRVIVMDKGKIVRQGRPKDIFSDVEFIVKLGLEVPIAANVAHRLQIKGVNLPNNIITDEELAEALCPSN